MDVLSVSEAWSVAQEIFGKAMVYENATSYYSSVSQLMQAQGWTAVTKGSEVLYYTRPAQTALASGVKTYTEVAEVTSVTVAESGAVTGATATTTGVGVTVAEAAIGGAAAACLGYNVGNQIYEANPEWWNGLLNETDEWIVENVPEGGVNAIVTVLEGVDTVLTFPSSLIERIRNYSIETGVYSYDIYSDIPSGVTKGDEISITNYALSFELYASAFEKTLDTYNISESMKNLARINIENLYYDKIKPTMDSNDYDGAFFIFNPSSLRFEIFAYFFKASNTGIVADCRGNCSYPAVGSGKYGDWVCVEITTESLYFIRYDLYISADSFSQSSPSIVSNVKLTVALGVALDATSLGTSTYNSYYKEKEITGITKQENAIYPDANTPLGELYPDWWNRRTTISNGEGGSLDWLPISIPSTDTSTLGDSQTQEQAQSGTNTNPDNNPNIEVVNSSGTNNKDNNPDSTDTGNTPVLLPSTSIFGIAGVYNPTLAQIKSFTSWLWSENPITQLQQMFSNPMNAIIGLHLIYATPITSDEKNIGVGYLNSGVSSKVVSEQYVTIDCGTINIPSYYNNVNDWNPYTKISCYLPFIGIVKLNTDDLMSSDGNFSQLNITYRVDVLTGACLAMLKIKRGSSDAVLYQYNGSCSVQLPLTSGNYGSIIASLITTAVGVVSDFAPLAIGGAMGLTHPKADIQRSGQLGANVGAMGIKKPYLIIERPYSKYAGSYDRHVGYPSNNTIKLSACSGFTRVKATDVNNINTTDEERKMIFNLLTNGIYI